ncbi:MAG: SIS domain-containing protein [Erysipelotrichaceae bacterium]|nr:SIS domain-containing protein [Erysipelotrichaceae bacterium]
MAKTIIESNRLFIYSIGDTNLTVRNFMNKLLKINIYPISATDNHEEIYTSQNVQKNDCVLFVSYSGLSHHYEECINIIKPTHCPIMLITANTKSPLVSLADDIILIDDKEKDERIATFYSQLAFQYILTLLYALIYRRVKRAEL